jgi:hypothetical protein
MQFDNPQKTVPAAQIVERQAKLANEDASQWRARASEVLSDAGLVSDREMVVVDDANGSWDGDVSGMMPRMTGSCMVHDGRHDQCVTQDTRIRCLIQADFWVACRALNLLRAHGAHVLDRLSQDKAVPGLELRLWARTVHDVLRAFVWKAADADAAAYATSDQDPACDCVRTAWQERVRVLRSLVASVPMVRRRREGVTVPCSRVRARVARRAEGFCGVLCRCWPGPAAGRLAL